MKENVSGAQRPYAWALILRDCSHGLGARRGRVISAQLRSYISIKIISREAERVIDGVIYFLNECILTAEYLWLREVGAGVG